MMWGRGGGRIYGGRKGVACSEEEEGLVGSQGWGRGRWNGRQ